MEPTKCQERFLISQNINNTRSTSLTAIDQVS